jgi:hypothetical protein
MDAMEVEDADEAGDDPAEGDEAVYEVGDEANADEVDVDADDADAADVAEDSGLTNDTWLFEDFGDGLGAGGSLGKYAVGVRAVIDTARDDSVMEISEVCRCKLCLGIGREGSLIVHVLERYGEAEDKGTVKCDVSSFGIVSEMLITGGDEGGLDMELRGEGVELGTAPLPFPWAGIGRGGSFEKPLEADTVVDTLDGLLDGVGRGSSLNWGLEVPDGAIDPDRVEVVDADWAEVVGTGAALDELEAVPGLGGFGSVNENDE